MPTLKNRDGGHDKNAAPPTLHEAMGLPGRKRYDAPGKIETVFKNVNNASTKGKSGGSKGGIKTSAGHDVSTRVNLPSAKAMGKSGRTTKRQKAG